MLYEIKSWRTGDVLFSLKCGTLKLCVEAAVKARANLRDSDLRGSNLSCIDLRGTNLRGSDLRDSNLRDSNLSGSDLSGSDLRGIDLSGSNLSGIDLSGSDLSCSNLRRSDLRGSDLICSDLRGSDLRDSNLSGSDLRGSDLRDSNLRGSNLRGSDLRGSDLPYGAIATKPPVQVSNALPWPITILGSHVMIGCQVRLAAEWESLTDDELAEDLKGDCPDAVDLRAKWLTAVSAFRDREGERLWAERQKVEA